MRERIGRIGEDDPVSQDILIGISDEVEKSAWMLRAQLEM
jgi:DNA-binding ferritin-like protein